jgi:hypothetical protein
VLLLELNALAGKWSYTAKAVAVGRRPSAVVLASGAGFDAIDPYSECQS